MAQSSCRRISMLLLALCMLWVNGVQPFDTSNCPKNGGSCPTCSAQRRNVIPNTLPLGRGFDLALADNIRFTKKPHVYKQHYCQGTASALWNHQLSCEQRGDAQAAAGLDTDHQATFSSFESLSDSWSMSANVQASSKSGAFGGSVSGLVSNLREFGGYLAIRTRTHLVGNVKLPSLECLNFTENYRRCFNQLNETDPTDDSYDTIFNDFGTHVVTEVEVGGRIIVFAKADECFYRHYTQTSFDFEASLVNIISFGIGSTETLTDDARKLNTDASFLIRGGSTSLYMEQDWQAYKQSVAQGKQSVIGFSRLTPLHQLVGNVGTQNDPRNLTRLEDTFRRATLSYLARNKIPAPSARTCSTSL